MESGHYTSISCSRFKEFSIGVVVLYTFRVIIHDGIFQPRTILVYRRRIPRSSRRLHLLSLKSPLSRRSLQPSGALFRDLLNFDVHSSPFLSLRCAWCHIYLVVINSHRVWKNTGDRLTAVWRRKGGGTHSVWSQQGFAHSMGDLLRSFPREDLGIVEISGREIEFSPGTRAEYYSIRSSRGC